MMNPNLYNLLHSSGKQGIFGPGQMQKAFRLRKKQAVFSYRRGRFGLPGYGYSPDHSRAAMSPGMSQVKSSIFPETGWGKRRR